jgi:hypothetical protein
MQHYKNHPIYGFAVSERGMLWHSRGVIFDPKHPTREIKRFECNDVICTSRKEAEEHALTLCRAWVDGLRSESKNRVSHS